MIKKGTFTHLWPWLRVSFQVTSVPHPGPDSVRQGVVYSPPYSVLCLSPWNPRQELLLQGRGKFATLGLSLESILLLLWVSFKMIDLWYIHGNWDFVSFLLLWQMPQIRWLKTTGMYYYSSGGQKSKTGLSGLKRRCWQGCISSGGSTENLFPCLFQFLEAAHRPWLAVSSSIFKASKSWLSLSPTASLQHCFHCHIFSGSSASRFYIKRSLWFHQIYSNNPG